VGEIDAAALQHVAFLDHATGAAAAFGAIPGIATKLLAVHLFHPLDDEFLQFQQKCFDLIDVHDFPLGWTFC
jgi:hypothetical protein